MTPVFSGKRFLVVEDDSLFRQSLASCLRRLGAVVEEAENGLTGLGMLCAGTFDVVLTDIRMPRMDGFELLSRARGSRTTSVIPTPFVVMSAFDTRETCSALHADAYIQKPFVMEKMIQTLDHCLQIRASELFTVESPERAHLGLNALWSFWFVLWAICLKLFAKVPSTMEVLFVFGIPLAFRAGFISGGSPGWLRWRWSRGRASAFTGAQAQPGLGEAAAKVRSVEAELVDTPEPGPITRP